MTLIAFVLHPWAKLIRSMHAIPRELADDLTVYAIGHNHERRFKDGYNATLCYLTLIGAKPAPPKCFAFSTLPNTRFRLSQEVWKHIHTRIKVITST